MQTYVPIPGSGGGGGGGPALTPGELSDGYYQAFSYTPPAEPTVIAFTANGNAVETTIEPPYAAGYTAMLLNAAVGATLFSELPSNPPVLLLRGRVPLDFSGTSPAGRAILGLAEGATFAPMATGTLPVRGEDIAFEGAPLVGRLGYLDAGGMLSPDAVPLPLGIPAFSDAPGLPFASLVAGLNAAGALILDLKARIEVLEAAGAGQSLTSSSNATY